MSATQHTAAAQPFDQAEQVEHTHAVLARIRPLGRLDKTTHATELAGELGVSLQAFKEATDAVGLKRSGEHYWFGLTSLRTAMKVQERSRAEIEIAARKRELEVLLARQGRRLTDLVKVRQVKPTKLSGVMTIRLTTDEAEQLEHALDLTGEPNLSAKVKACVRAYPELREIRTSYVSLKKELELLKEAVNALPELILNLTLSLQDDREK